MSEYRVTYDYWTLEFPDGTPYRWVLDGPIEECLEDLHWAEGSAGSGRPRTKTYRSVAAMQEANQKYLRGLPDVAKSTFHPRTRTVRCVEEREVGPWVPLRDDGLWMLTEEGHLE